MVAIKVLDADQSEDYGKENDILKTLRAKQHKHLINLLASFQMGNKYHLVFPYADSNLRQYWEQQPNPVFDSLTVLWALEQMRGIACGTNVIHEFRASIPLAPAEGFRFKDGAKLSVAKDEVLFGRHGDLKPENILWFDDPETDAPHKGNLKIADFGLGRFHGRDSRSNVDPVLARASPTYEPPECRMRIPVSRKYDIWSLGCIYLEFITWLLEGDKHITVFSEARGEPGADGIDEDKFFTVIPMGERQPRVVIRKGVVDWAIRLHTHSKCSALIHMLIDMTMNKLLVVDPKNRATAAQVQILLTDALMKSKSDQVYLLRPAPASRNRGHDNMAHEAPPT